MTSTTAPLELDAIVVGAGPGGAAAALTLARNRRRVLLLDKCAFPRDKTCGDGLTRSAVCLLHEMGVLPHLPEGPKIRGARIYAKGRASRDFHYPKGLEWPEFGLVLPRLDLDAAICRRAVAEGAEFWEEADVRQLLYMDGRASGVEVVHGGETKRIYARAIIAADGASSRLALQAGLVGTEPHHFGFAIRGYYSGVDGMTDLLEIYTPLLDATDRYLLPSYGWVFPTGPGTVNVGVGFFQKTRGANVRRMMERFVAFLSGEDSRFEQVRSCGRWTGAPLRFDFAPQRCMADGLLLVGDAAGLISPFTGEGISYALASGRLAAEVIQNSLRKDKGNRPDLSDYTRRLAEGNTGYFEAGRHAARRYKLVWQMLQSTFQSERPLFALCRRAVLAPEGVAEPVAPATLENFRPLMHTSVFRVKADLQRVCAHLTDTMRQEWPIMAQLAQPGEREYVLFRPALLLLLCFYAGGGRDDLAVLSAAAVEMGHLAALAHASVSEDSPEESRQANWGNLFALGVGDFLLSKAYQFSAGVGPPTTAAISQAMAHATEARVIEWQHAHDPDLASADQLDIIGRKTAMLFELPCRLGARCGSLAEPQVEALGRYGRGLGITHYLVDELLEVTEVGEPLGSAAGADLADGLYSLSIRCAARHGSAAATALRAMLATGSLSIERSAEVRRLVRETGAVTEVLSFATQAKNRAQEALRMVDNGPIRRVLHGLAESALSRIKR